MTKKQYRRNKDPKTGRYIPTFKEARPHQIRVSDRVLELIKKDKEEQEAAQ